MPSNAHLRLVGGTSTRINIPDIVEFNMKDMVQALSGVSSKDRFIKAFMSNGQITFQATQNPVGDYTFKNPLGSDPEKALTQDGDIYATMRRYRGPIIAMCRALVERWNKESNRYLERGIQLALLRFNEDIKI